MLMKDSYLENVFYTQYGHKHKFAVDFKIVGIDTGVLIKIGMSLFM